tara:strand:+ start:24081 stop:24338 length:258 start_codon:yes stop_codon:yes gene_type:complete
MVNYNKYIFYIIMSDLDFKNVIEIQLINDIIEKSNHPIKNDLISFMNALGELVNIRRLATENLEASTDEDYVPSTEEETDEEWEH